MAYTAFSAKNALVRIGGQPFVGFTWRVKSKSAKIDTTSFEGNGYSTGIGSIYDATFTVQGFMDLTTSPWGPPTNIIEGQNANDLKLYLNGLGGLFWWFPVWGVEEDDTDAEVRDGMKISFSGYNAGTYFRPGNIS